MTLTRTRRQRETKDNIDGSVMSNLEKQKPKKEIYRGVCGKISTDVLLILILIVLLSFRANFSADKNVSSTQTIVGNGNFKDIVSPIQSPSYINLKQNDFLSIGTKYGTDKVAGNAHLKACLEDGECARIFPMKALSKRPKCRPWGHFYNTFYQRQLGHLSQNSPTNHKEFQFLEIGFFNGKGFDSFAEFLPSAEMHSMEISCMKGYKKYNNTADEHANYNSLVAEHRLHCGDASNVAWLHNIWTTKMNRKDGTAPPLKIVVDDGSHMSEHMAQTVFFWFPRIQPRGVLIVEDIQPIQLANTFRTQFLPQIMSDLHYCGDPTFVDNGPCYPTLMPLLASVYCEMHICMFERNDEPAIDLDLVNSTMPHTALDASQCKSLERK